MSLMQKIKMRFLLFIGKFYFTSILLVTVLLLITLLAAVANTDRVTNLYRSGQTIVILAIIVFGILKGTFKALFLKIPKPEGILLKEKNAPELYQLIKGIRKSTKCPKIHYIMLNYDFNAFISERPSIGTFGWFRRYLVIGLPLFITLNEAELKAVIAHECGHLSKSHGKSGLKIYRAKTLWESISKELIKDGDHGGFLVNKFIKRYIPALNSLYFSIIKNQEFQADKIALSVVDKQTFADSLVKLSLYNYLAESSFWPEIKRLNHEMPEPVEDLFLRMEDILAKPIPREVSTSYIDGIMAYRSLPCSTHPSYIERIEALGAEVPTISEITNTSLRSIFKKSGSEILTTCNKNWYDAALGRWKEYYDHMSSMKNRLDELEKKENTEELTVDDMLERAFLMEEVVGIDSALDDFKLVKEKYPDNLASDYNIGRLLTYRGEEAGVEILRKIMEKDYQAIPDCSFHIMNYFLYKNDRESASSYYYHAVKFMETNEDVKNERNSIRLSDKFLPHDLSNESIERIRGILLKYKQIKKAYVAIKHVEFSGQFPLYVLCIKYGSITREKRMEIQNEILQSRIMPWEYFAVPLNGKNIEIEYKLDQIYNTRIL